MRNWMRAVLTTPGALADIREHLAKLAQDEDSLSKVKDTESLHFQRGKVAGIQHVLAQISLAAQEKR